MSDSDIVSSLLVIHITLKALLDHYVWLVYYYCFNLTASGIEAMVSSYNTVQWWIWHTSYWF